MFQRFPSFLLSSSWPKRLALAGLGWLAGGPAQAQFVSSFAPTAGVAGTAVTLTGSGFLGATAVTFNGVAAAAFTVNSSGTSVTAVAPAGVSTGYVRVTAPTITGNGTSPSTFVVKQPSTRTAIVMDGYREVLYGNALAVQANPTGFGNATNGSQTDALNGSELDATYAYVQGDSLHVFMAGNLENNSNALDVFFDSQAGGQNTLAALGSTMPYNNLVGLTFDQGFTADYALIAENINSTVYAQFFNLRTGTVSALGTGLTFSRSVTFSAGPYAGRLGMDQSNTGGVDATAAYGAAPAGVVTGVEFVLPLAALGSPTGSLKLASFIGNGMQNFLSNQSLDALPSGTANLGIPGPVNFNTYAGNQYVTVPLQANGVPITSYAPANGVAGTAVTITGSGFAGATGVQFNGVSASSFVVNSSTSITAVVPAGATTGPLAVATTAGPSISTTSFVVDQPRASTILLDGYREARYGAARAVQTTPTGFGNATNGNQSTALNGSELDAAYTYVSGDSLYVFLAGNLENNGNQVELFFDSQAGGQNTLASTNPNVDGNGLNALAGLTFDQGFTADYYLSLKGGQFAPNILTAYFASLGAGGTGISPASTSLGGTGYLLNLPGGRTGRLALDNSNTGGVSDTSVGVGVPDAVVTGLELALPLSALGFPVGSVKVTAFVNGGSHAFLSNQVLGGLPSGTANLGIPGPVNFSTYAGNQYFTAPIPAVAQLTRFNPASGPVGTSVTIVGTGLTTTSAVAFNGTPAAGFTLNADGNQLTVQVPVGATAGPITVTTAGGTTATATGFCVQYPATAANVSRCGAGSVTLTASGAPTGGTYSYYAALYGGAVLGTGSTFTTPSLSFDATYYVGITTGSGATACEGPRTAIGVTINTVSPATITATGSTTVCQGGSVVLTASSGSSYLWSNGATTQSISATQAGSYTVTVTNFNGCPATSAATTVTVNPQPTVSITAGGPTTFCQGGAVVLTASLGRFYRWSTNETTQSIVVRQPGSYTVQVSDGISCGGTSAATVVTVNPLPTASITASTSTAICVGSSVVLTATPGASYQWSTGATTQSITVMQAGSYTVTVSDGTCTATSAATTVTVSPLPSATITVSGPTAVCQSGGGSTVLTASTGASYVWSTGAATQSITVTQPGSYTVQVSNGTCTATSTPTVIGASPAPTQPTVTQSTAGGVTTLTSSATSGNQWYRNGIAIAGATGPTYTPTSAGTYTVVVTATNGCASVASAGQAIVLATTSAALAAQVQLHPNPTQGEVTLSLPGVVSAQAIRVQVLNALGQEVPARATITSTSIQLDLAGLPTGVYAVRVQLGPDTLVKRVVLE